jgi:hypothetical protein
MAYAPHTNTDVQRQLRAGQVPSEFPMIFGGFTEADGMLFFEYAERRWHDDNFAPEMPHMIYVGAGDVRLAKVLKTVAYIVVDEDADGNPVVEKWHIKNHRIYDTSWVRA